MRRKRMTGGVAMISLAAAACPAGAIVAGASARGQAPAGAPRGQRARPPLPLVGTRGVTRTARLVSYCWTERLSNGSVRGTCADGVPGHPTHTLRWSPHGKIRVDLGLPAHDVRVQAIRIDSRSAARPRHVIELKVVKADAAGRRWWLRLPDRARPDTDLLIAASFAGGDVLADIGLRVGTAPAG